MSVWFAETWLATTLLMALVMMLRRPVARWLGAGAAYLLWALPLARMLLPALPQDVASPSPLQHAVDQVGLPALLVQAPAAEVAQGSAALPWLELGIGVWLAGVIAFLALHGIGYVRFRRLILRDATPLGEEGRIRIVSSAQASGPLAFGVIRPYIVLPADFGLRFDAQEQDMAIAHERAHHERADLAANLVSLGLLALHWCNPVAWIAYRAYRADQELACDARVLALYGQDQAHAYGRAILKAAGGRQFAAACHLNRLDTLKGRLIMLSNHAASLHRISWGMAAVALLTTAGLALTASGSRAAQQMAAITDRVEDASLTRLATLMMQPPRAPQAATAPIAPLAPMAPTDVVEAPPATAAMADPVDTVVPMAPQAPVPPAPADVVPPMPPMPPVRVTSDEGRITVRHADGRREVHRIPTAAEIRRMVPVVDVRNGCEGGDTVSQRETVTSDGRRHIRVRICQAAIERQARQARQAARADIMAARADVMAARAEVARDMSSQARAEALRDMDREIADLRREERDEWQ
jgi:beta-lactamase regulating signal transducer with metallopeptidase domain